ncbi:hypothetical protein FVEN_g2645 [Fusarium venenatum]|uniref:Mitochondrial GTPase 1 n=1 Tax=Fusarium venenatum TaxID=56646 RepID=A0A2L2SVT1_9HYPO|nr:uncharacterized protein FVRRES_05124 [Fusarium venenatum]KAG8359989.1 hypothetical protein FVEN_g2645 [Fusarium venenatum]KAH6992246.1 P-loop containing nucleoside triphosphate hydrolase protein [Fusarium venenatum]CEI60688.1 unnamed protein product [Fusarium venenatum]
MAQFIPRQTFGLPNSIPKTYYLGHHATAQSGMIKRLNNIHLILECRDLRLPLTTNNPILEQSLAGRERIVVFTKCDLTTNKPEYVNALRKLYGDRFVLWNKESEKTTKDLLRKVKDVARAVDSITGMRAMIVGMPNVGKSSLLNTLRSNGLPQKTKKSAKTGGQPGITRKIGTSVRIVETKGNDPQRGVGEGVFMLDTPGVFVPYVDNPETMIKIALVQGIKVGLVPSEVLVDYLLYRLNKIDPAFYEQYSKPTNSVEELLTSIATKTGKLKAGGSPNFHGAASVFLKDWRTGKLGKFMLEDLTDEAIEEHQQRLINPPLSMNQAKKQLKEARAQERAGA